MKIEVTEDTSRREIWFVIEDGTAPDIDVTESWHLKPRAMRPKRGMLVVVDGDVRGITVNGTLILKSGKASDQTWVKRHWRATAYNERDRIENAPGWVREIWQQAPGGITGFTWTDEELNEPD